MARKTRLAALLITVSAAATVFTAPNGDGARWWSHVEALANDRMQGRLTGSPEHRQAAQYVAAQFERAGLAPAGTSGYLQPVTFDVRRIVESQSSLELVRQGAVERLTLGEDAFVALRVDPAEAVDAPLVFAGYGLVVPELKFDDLAGQDLKGKIIVIFGGGPSSIPGPLKSHYSYSTERGRFLQQAGVVGMVTIVNPHTSDVPWARTSQARLQESMSLTDPALVDMKGLKIAVNVNAAHADKWFAGSGHTVAELLALVDAGKPLPHFALVPSMRAKVKVERRQVESENVVAKLTGSDPALRNEHVVISGHLDHLGVGEPVNGDRIYNGAMDNAAGVASMLDIAQQLHDSGARLKRSLLFVAVTGEEKGLLGSRYFAAHPTVDPNSMVADVNLDMFLPLYPFRIVTTYGLKESDLGDTVRQVAGQMHLEVQDDPAPVRDIFVRSDQYNFIRHGIPAVMIDVGNKKGSRDERIEKEWLTTRYHAPSDDLEQPIDLQAAVDFNRFSVKLAETVANNAARPQWKPDSFFRRFQPQAPAAPAGANYDESRVPAYTLPDPLVMADGKKVTDAKTWTGRRRPELLTLFETHVYGKTPVGRPSQMTWEVVSEDRNANDGTAIAKTVTLYFPNERNGSSRMRMNLYLTLPKTGQRVPAFLIAGVGRSGQPPALNQPVFDHGYGMAYADILALQPDQEDAAGGYADSIRKFYAPANQEEPGESEWGALASWAWALSRAMDYLQADKDLDPRRIHLNGVSRYGKAAMWAGAQDTRFAATFSGESGCGGAVIVRRQYGETVRAITGSFPYWFARKFADYADDVNALPVDWHELVALHAPRPVYIATAEGDRWGDPRGSFLSGRNADPVYALFGETGVGVDDMPPVATPVGQRIGFHMRTGSHGQNEYDWVQFMAFADKHFGAPRRPR